MEQKTITLSEKAQTELKEIGQQIGAGTAAETIRKSVGLARYLAKEMHDGKEVIIRDTRTKDEVVLVSI